MTSNYPYVVKPSIQEERDGLKNHQPRVKYVHIGPKGYRLPEHFVKHAVNIYNMPIRSTDIFVNSFPRSGTTWTMELTWLVANDLDFETAKSTALYKRFPHLEGHILWTEYSAIEEISTLPILTHTFETPARFIKTHLPLSMLPGDTLDTAKVIYVARDPRDVAVSYYHLIKASFSSMTCQFKEYFESSLTQNMVLYAPLFEHVKEAWAQRHHPNMLFIFYEELSKDLKGTAKRVAKFLNKEYSDVQLDQLCDHLKFENFQKNTAVAVPHLKYQDKYFKAMDAKNFIRKGQDLKGTAKRVAKFLNKEYSDVQLDQLCDHLKFENFQKNTAVAVPHLKYQDKYFKAMDAKNFIRKGKVGGWREHFDEELAVKAQRWMEENLRGTDLRYPCQDF